MKIYNHQTKLRIYSLTKNDINTLLDTILKEFTKPEKINLRISASIKNADITESLTNDFWSHADTSSVFDNLYISVEDHESKNSIRLSFRPETTSLGVSSGSQFWLNGMEKLISDYLAPKRRFLGFVNSQTRYTLQGALSAIAFIGTSFLLSSVFTGFIINESTTNLKFYRNPTLWSIVFLVWILAYILNSAKNRIDRVGSKNWSRADYVGLAGIIVGILGIFAPIMWSLWNP